MSVCAAVIALYELNLLDDDSSSSTANPRVLMIRVTGCYLPRDWGKGRVADVNWHVHVAAEWSHFILLVHSALYVCMHNCITVHMYGVFYTGTYK